MISNTSKIPSSVMISHQSKRSTIELRSCVRSRTTSDFASSAVTSDASSGLDSSTVKHHLPFLDSGYLCVFKFYTLGGSYLKKLIYKFFFNPTFTHHSGAHFEMDILKWIWAISISNCRISISSLFSDSILLSFWYTAGDIFCSTRLTRFIFT